MSKDTNDKNWFARHKVLTVVIAVVAVLGIAGAAAGGEEPTQTASQSDTTTPVKQEVPKEWKVVAELAGVEANKKTDAFALQEGDVRIRYEIEGKTNTTASLLYLLKEGTTKSTNERGDLELAPAVATVIGTDKSQKITKQHAGKYFFEINSSDPFTYKIFIEQ